MDATAQAYEQIISNFVAWAEQEQDIRAALVIGSRARQDHPADEWSDLDILIIAHHPQRYWQESEWIQQIGVPWLTFVEQTADGRSWERRVMFEGGLDVDFSPVPLAVAQAMVEQGLPPDVANVLRRGVRLLLDKDSIFSALLVGLPDPQPVSPPPQSEYLQLVNDFWYHSVWTAKHLRRGELWWAKSGCDSYLKGLLRQMLEWHARATRGPQVDTWMRGRFLEEWADPRAVQALGEAFAHYDEQDVWRALFATIDLFRWLEAETAERLGYPPLELGEQRASQLVQKLYAGSRAARK